MSMYAGYPALNVRAGQVAQPFGASDSGNYHSGIYMHANCYN